MAAGDIEVYTAAVDDDGTKLAAVLAGNVVVADDVTICSLPGNRVCVVVVKAA